MRVLQLTRRVYGPDEEHYREISRLLGPVCVVSTERYGLLGFVSQAFRMSRRSDLVVANDFFLLGLVALIVSKINRKPLLVTAHGVDWGFAMRRFWVPVFWHLFRRPVLLLCDLVKVDCEATKRLLIMWHVPEAKIRVLGSYVDLELFKPEPVPHEHPTLLYVGSRDPVKGVDRLLDIFSKIREKIPSVQLHVCGFKYREVPGVTYHGYVPHDKLPEHYNCCDVYVQASYSESFGRSVAEAMACGKPVVVFNVGGLSETVGGGGLLVPDNDSEGFVKSVVWLLQNPDAVSKLGAEARKQALKYEFYSREKRLVEVYEEARGRGRISYGSHAMLTFM
jgi:glycosyltransferase involved in cell wall biosynthesis